MGDRLRRTREAAGPAVLALLLVMSLAAPALSGLAAAQSDSYTKSIDASNVEYIAMDTSEINSEFTVHVTTPDLGSGSTTLYYGTHSPAGVVETPAVLRNAKAYDTVNVTVSGVSSAPEIGPGENFDRLDWRNKDVWTSTGGDTDLRCDTSERLAQAVNPAIEILDCNNPEGPESANATGLDANETKLEIYQSAAAQSDSAENFHTMLDNRLQDTETVALVKGKGAYMHEWNQTGSETSARAASKENITEYYSVMERNLLAEWNGQLDNIQYLRALSREETGVPDSYVTVPGHDRGENVNNVTITGFGTRSYTLQNGSNVDVRTIDIYVHQNDDNAGGTVTIGPSDGAAMNVDFSEFNGDHKEVDLKTVVVNPPTSNYDTLEALRFNNTANALSDIDAQTESAIGQMDTVVNQTIDGLQSGDITIGDMMDPYVLQNQFSPGDDYQGWAAANLAMLGTNQPTDLDSTGYMNITLEDGSQLQGIVQSRSNPPSGKFAVNETYNPANIGGSQWITTDSEVRELTQNFTVKEVRTTDGERRQNFTIEKKTYETTSAEDLEELNQELALLREEISAREDNLNSGIGGGGLLGGGSQTVVLVLVAGAVAVVVLSNGGRR